MQKNFKQVRFGKLLLNAASDPLFFDQVHVILGGTGAVGGATALHIIDFFEEACRYPAMRQERPPYIVITGHTHREIREFTNTLFGIHQRDYGCEPERVRSLGYRTATGAVVEMQTLSVDPSIAEMKNAAKLSRESCRKAVERFLQDRGLSVDSATNEKFDALFKAIRQEGAQPFSSFLESFREKRGIPAPGNRFQSVVITIPLASVATYQRGDLERFARLMGLQDEEIEELKEAYLQAFPDDLANVARSLAQEVLVAHTTGVGGMYDEDSEGRRSIRLGFAHSGLGEKLREKQQFADKLTQLYSDRGIRMLVTAAAIGVDAILHKKSIRIQPSIRTRLEMALRSGHPIVPEADLKGANIHVYQPLAIDIFAPGHEEVRLSRGWPLIPDYTVKSGENGYFTVSNADALYRIMRVASASELGFVLARMAVFGDDGQRSFFEGNICNYTETDYSRQVFDLLDHPPLRDNQLLGLQPKALQDLGSPKHQAELHTLGLLILLHRLKTLDLSAISQNVDLTFFDPQTYFERHSKPLTLEDIATWDADTLAQDLTTLVTARSEDDLALFKNFRHPHREPQKAAHRVLQAVLRAVWAIPSLGTPILFQKEGKALMAAGYFLAPLDRIHSHQDGILTYLQKEFEAAQAGLGRKKEQSSEEDFGSFAEFHFANGFADLRPQATLVTALSHTEDLEGKVAVYRSEEEFTAALARLEPYSYFTSSGLLALLTRLKGLACFAHQLNLELGTANYSRVQFSYDEGGRALLVPGVVEAFRMVSEGLEKNTGAEFLDGYWGYGWPQE